MNRILSAVICGFFLLFQAPSAFATHPVEIAKLLASDAAESDEFGYSVAVSGDTAVIGAHRDDDAGVDSGSAYVFTRSGATWTQQAKLTASDAAASDQFGFSVAVSGTTAVVGANFDDHAGNASGSAYVFTRSGTTWTQQAKLTASDAAPDDQFGFSVAVDGDTALVGASFDGDAGNDSGSAYVFFRTGTTWEQQEKLTADDAAAGDEFGGSVALSGGTLTEHTALVGARAEGGSGAAYVFTRVRTRWRQQAKLTASDAALDDQFGFSVAVSDDIAVVGANFDDDAGNNSGSAYVFKRSGRIWTEYTKLTAGNAAAGDEYGGAVALSGTTAVVGVNQDDEAAGNGGSAYLFSLRRFHDVPAHYWAIDFIERLAASGITAGCGNDNYCPEDSVTRAQMAVFLERGIHGSDYVPPAATGNVFLDVGAGSFAASFIEQLLLDGITSGCGNSNYCPGASVTRAQMAVFLLRARYGAAYLPPAASGVFDDVDLGHWAVHWIEQLADEGITVGCGDGNYCPANPVTRAQMAVFLVRTFEL